jgi:hypothetical protein
VYPDLYHKYVGHDDNRDWFMFTQKETRMNIELVQNKYKPIITHDMHQQGPNNARIFVPPFTEPFDPNMHPLLRWGNRRWAGDGGAAGEGKEGRGVDQKLRHGSPACSMVYHGQPRILTEIANSNLADPYVNPRRASRSVRRNRAPTSRCRTRKTRGRWRSRWTTASPWPSPACRTWHATARSGCTTSTRCTATG